MKFKLLYISLLMTGSLICQNLELKLKALPAHRYRREFVGEGVAMSGNFAIVGAFGNGRDSNESNFFTSSGAAYIYEKDVNGNWSLKQKLVASDRSEFDIFGSDVAISGNYAFVSAYQDYENATGGSPLADAGSVYVFERNSSGVWKQVQKLVASDRQIEDGFGFAVALNGNYGVVTAIHEDHNATGGAAMLDAGSAYIFERNGSGVWVQVKKIVASDRDVDDNFGYDVSLDGNTMVIGAWNEDHNATGGSTLSDAGSAYVFERNTGGIWSQTAKIVASDRAVDDIFGLNVAVKGNTIMVGAGCDDEDASGANTMTNSGSVYIYEKKSGVWTQVQKIVASDRQAFGIFSTVALDVDYALIGAHLETKDVNGKNAIFSAGAAYLFKRNLSTGLWSQVQKITSNLRQVDARFGEYVSISGNSVIVGSHQDCLNASGADSLHYAGAAYIFYNCLPSFSTMSPVACKSYLSRNGVKYTSSAVYTDTLTSYTGCDSLITVNLTVTNSNKTVTQNKDTLIATEAVGTYQWIDCNKGGQFVNGAKSKKFVPTKSGSYAVIIDNNGCLDTSVCYSINLLSLNEKNISPSFSLYPNPGSGLFEIKNPQNIEIHTIRIYDNCGKLVSIYSPELENLKINLTSNAAGLYTLELEGDGFRYRLKLIKSN